jgi:hypothetical protein
MITKMEIALIRNDLQNFEKYSFDWHEKKAYYKESSLSERELIMIEVEEVEVDPFSKMITYKVVEPPKSVRVDMSLKLGPQLCSTPKI